MKIEHAKSKRRFVAFGDELNRVIHYVEMEQHELASVLGCSPATVSNYINGKYLPPPSIFVDIIEAIPNIAPKYGLVRLYNGYSHVWSLDLNASPDEVLGPLLYLTEYGWMSDAARHASIFISHREQCGEEFDQLFTLAAVKAFVLSGSYSYCYKLIDSLLHDSSNRRESEVRVALIEGIVLRAMGQNLAASRSFTHGFSLLEADPKLLGRPFFNTTDMDFCKRESWLARIGATTGQEKRESVKSALGDIGKLVNNRMPKRNPARTCYLDNLEFLQRCSLMINDMAGYEDFAFDDDEWCRMRMRGERYHFLLAKKCLLDKDRFGALRNFQKAQLIAEEYDNHFHATKAQVYQAMVARQWVHENDPLASV